MQMRIFLITALALPLVGCATTKIEKTVEAEVAQQPARSMGGEVAGKGFHAILNSPSLSEDQKQQFMRLHQKIAAEVRGIDTEMSKLKGVLFETVFAQPYEPEKVEVLKKRLLKLNNAKMDKMLTALNEVKRIVDYKSPVERRELIRDLIQFHDPRWEVVR